MSSKTTQPPSVQRFGTRKLSLTGCIVLGLGFLALFAVIFVITGFIFTWAFNIVAPIFGGPVITTDQGLVLWFLIWLIASAFKKAT